MALIHTIILAAGQGKRMKSPLSKILHHVGGRTLIAHAVAAAQGVQSSRTVIVVPPVHNAVLDELAHVENLRFAVQAKPLGTGHAVQAGLTELSGSAGILLILNGDMPLIRPTTVRTLLKTHQKRKATLTILTAHFERPDGMGRIVRNSQGQVIGIVEDKDATAAQKRIHEGNVGVYCIDLAFARSALKNLKTHNSQKEYYLTDLVGLALSAGKTVAAQMLPDATEATGVNSQAELAQANLHFYERQRTEFMAGGVTLLGSEIFIDAGVRIKPGAHIESPCYLKGETRIGASVRIESSCVIKDSTVGDGGHLKAFCYLDHARCGLNCHIGPFAHLRPETQLENHVRIGNFVEIKKTLVKDHAKVNHLSYLGDASIGRRVNVGAGTITCNYDGVHKHKTVIEDDVFIGSDTQLVAPVRIGKGAVIGAGTTVTHNVVADSLVLSRVRQHSISDWTQRRRAKGGKS